MGIIYLIQPEELVGTNRYKIGCSVKNDLSRVNSYKKQSRYLCIMECKNPFILEKNIKLLFNKTFKKIAGNEYFEGNESDIIKEFIKCYTDFTKHDIINNISESNIDEDEDKVEDEDEDNINEIKKIFPNYIEDENYGGNKQLIKIKIETNNYNNEYDITVIYIDEDENNNINEQKIYYYDYMEEYIKKILENNIIENNNIYDFNNKKFLKKLDKYKTKLNIILSDEIKTQLINNNDKDNNSKYDKIKYNLMNNTIITIINNKFYCDSYPIGDDNQVKINIYYNPYVSVSGFKLFNTYYEYNYLREYIPYIIEININRYYLINRNYVYIGLNTHRNPLIIDNKIIDNKIIDNEINKYWERIYLFNDGSKPWDDNKYFKEMYSKFLNLTKDKECLNRNEETFYLLSIN